MIVIGSILILVAGVPFVIFLVTLIGKKKPLKWLLISISFFVIGVIFLASNSGPKKVSKKEIRPKPTVKKPTISAAEEKQKIDAFFNIVLKSVEGYKKVVLSGDRETLTITVSDKWYYTPKFQKERIMETTGKQFAVFSAQMGWRGSSPSEANYPTVLFEDIASKRVGRHSTWGTKIYE